MKKRLFSVFLRILLPGIILLGILSAVYLYLNRNTGTDQQRRIGYEKFIRELNRLAPVAMKAEGKENPAADEPGMAAYHEFLLTLDPATGTVPRERLREAVRYTRAVGSLKQDNPLVWQGYPSDMGGRTRAIMYDPNDPTRRKVWAGGVTGGLWYNSDITNENSPWIPVGDFWANLAIRCITYDPQQPTTFYVGTGEVETALQTYRESSGVGFGIQRSTDGGVTWNPVPGTEQFAYVTDIVVRVESGVSVIYAGVASGLYKGKQHHSLPSDGLFRSANGGTTWQQVMPLIPGSSVPYCISDIALGADNRLYAGTRPNLDGEGAAVLLRSDDGLNWTANTQYQAEILASPTNNIPGRVVLATAPSDANIVYALVASGYVNTANGFQYFNCYHILRSADKGVTWVKKPQPTDLTSGNNFATIAWHALDVGVDPNNPDRLFIGGLDVHGSFDGGSTWNRVSDWALMYYGGGTRYLHADQHVILFKPGSSDEILFGTDGGVFYTADGTGYLPAFEERNKEFSTLQFYTCALHPEAGLDYFYGGLQDNGTLLYTGTPLALHDMVTGGDGAYCFFDQSDPSLSITSYYYNHYSVFQNGSYVNGINDWPSGTFVSPAGLDHKLKYLYCNAVDYIGTYADQIVRFGNLTGPSDAYFLDLNTGSTVFFSALTWSPWSPAGKSTLFVGSESGRLFRVAEAQGAAPVVTEIGSPLFPAASLSCIAVGKSEDTLLVTFSNYGVSSVWQTWNGGQTWQDIEGNLPDMPVRWALLHPQNNRQALLATETGVWESTDLNQNPVSWHPAVNGMANVRVDMMQMRPADNRVLAATHGRGFFTATWDLFTGSGEKHAAAVKIVPNPSTGIFSVSAGKALPERSELTVYSLAGEVVLRKPVPAGRSVITADLTGKPAGAYLVRIEAGERILSAGKLILH